ncbi:MAG: biotin transporter BioY [Christensenellaceae bacterium]|jgi:biotin transport system substrate-specific component|nr:biotin transporter BioY [Christensenellaceae bacterium]
MRKIRIRDLTLCALFAALSAIFSQLSLPIGPVPINLTHLSIFLAAGLLGANLGALSQLAFVLLGIVGLPVFSGFSGGLSVLLGPTGGFIAGYIACAYVAGLVIERFGHKLPSALLAMVLGLVVTYALGLAWFMYSTGSSLAASLPLCVLPFLPGDAAKILVSALLVGRLRPLLHREAR